MTGRIVPFHPPNGQSAEKGATAGVGPTAPLDRRVDTGDRRNRGRLDDARQSRFRGLILPHLASAYSLARYLCGDAVAAEDIAQDAMLKAYRAFDGFRGEAAKPWLLDIVRNTHLDWIRRNRPWRAMARSEDDLATEVADAGADPERVLVEAGDAQALRAAIMALPEPFREALVLRTVEDLSYRQIAEVTGITIGTVMSRLARARALLAHSLGLGPEITP